MEKLSAKTFFTVMWRGVCQAIGWFFGLFGYKRDGRFAKCVWGLFSVSAAIIMAFFALFFVVAGSREIYLKKYKESHCYSPDCVFSDQIRGDIYFHNICDEHGYVYNARTQEKILKNVEWIAMPLGKDSLVCFSDGKKRGYFNKNTGKVVIKPKYDHAWIFSEGIAAVDEGGHVTFINPMGETIIDRGITCSPDMNDYVFHGGYCVVNADDGEHFGLIDKKGRIALTMDYSSISLSDDALLWHVEKEGKNGVMDMNMKTIVPLTECSMWIMEGTIDMTMPDHTMRKYDYSGCLLDDFYISGFRMLEYEKDEIVNYRPKENEEEDEFINTTDDSYHPKATARLRAYIAGDSYMGLMTADGQKVTMPLYQDITAIGPDMYLCTVTNYDKVIVNGKGEVVKKP